MQSDVIVYFDYLCPYAWRGAEVAEMVSAESGISFDWRLFSLVQSNRTDMEFQIWNEKLDPDDPSGTHGLLPFLATLAARRQGRDKEDAFRLALQRARHVDHKPFSMQVIAEVAAASGLDEQKFESDLADPELRTQLAQEHHKAEQQHIFGTPTFSFGDNGGTAYLRIRELPVDADEAMDLFNRYRNLLKDFPYLETVKRPRNNGN